ncbi:MAG: hypothetical protein COY78_00825 [Candidatus Omnitrophica bacterium CG_4_10_14_0_8_um_filter_44_12]|nr:MAG: hypothetical protein COY78_00825 [Candidatus Omnitrophica bacterium CG_4_10_14_0_8_um_filter_44_12]
MKILDQRILSGMMELINNKQTTMSDMQILEQAFEINKAIRTLFHYTPKISEMYTVMDIDKFSPIAEYYTGSIDAKLLSDFNVFLGAVKAGILEDHRSLFKNIVYPYGCEIFSARLKPLVGRYAFEGELVKTPYDKVLAALLGIDFHAYWVISLGSLDLIFDVAADQFAKIGREKYAQIASVVIPFGIVRNSPQRFPMYSAVLPGEEILNSAGGSFSPVGDGEEAGKGSGERDALKIYLKEIRVFELLGADEEERLSRIILSSEPPSDDYMQAREVLIQSNLRLVVSIARKNEWKGSGAGLDLLDLIQTGNKMLIRVAEKFEASKGKFSNYAGRCIEYALKRAIGEEPQLPADKLHKFYALKKELGGMPTAQEAANKFGVTDYESGLILMANQYDSLERPVGEDGDSALGDFIAGSDARTEDLGGMEYNESIMLLKRYMDKIGIIKRHQDMFLMREYTEGEPPSFKDIGIVFKDAVGERQISGVRVRAIIGYVKNKVRDNMESDGIRALGREQMVELFKAHGIKDGVSLLITAILQADIGHNLSSSPVEEWNENLKEINITSQRRRVFLKSVMEFLREYKPLRKDLDRLVKEYGDLLSKFDPKRTNAARQTKAKGQELRGLSGKFLDIIGYQPSTALLAQKRVFSPSREYSNVLRFIFVHNSMSVSNLLLGQIYLAKVLIDKDHLTRKQAADLFVAKVFSIANLYMQRYSQELGHWLDFIFKGELYNGTYLFKIFSEGRLEMLIASLLHLTEFDLELLRFGLGFSQDEAQKFHPVGGIYSALHDIGKRHVDIDLFDYSAELFEKDLQTNNSNAGLDNSNAGLEGLNGSGASSPVKNFSGLARNKKVYLLLEKAADFIRANRLNNAQALLDDISRADLNNFNMVVVYYLRAEISILKDTLYLAEEYYKESRKYLYLAESNTSFNNGDAIVYTLAKFDERIWLALAGIRRMRAEQMEAKFMSAGLFSSADIVAALREIRVSNSYIDGSKRPMEGLNPSSPIIERPWWPVLSVEEYLLKPDFLVNLNRKIKSWPASSAVSIKRNTKDAKKNSLATSSIMGAGFKVDRSLLYELWPEKKGFIDKLKAVYEEVSREDDFEILPFERLPNSYVIHRIINSASILEDEDEYLERYREAMRQRTTKEKELIKRSRMPSYAEGSTLGSLDRDLSIFFTEGLRMPYYSFGARVLLNPNLKGVFLLRQRLIIAPGDEHDGLFHEGIHFDSEGFSLECMDEGFVQFIWLKYGMARTEFKPDLSRPVIKEAFDAGGIEYAYFVTRECGYNCRLSYSGEIAFACGLVKLISEKDLLDAFIRGKYSPHMKMVFDRDLWKTIDNFETYFFGKQYYENKVAMIKQIDAKIKAKVEEVNSASKTSSPVFRIADLMPAKASSESYRKVFGEILHCFQVDGRKNYDIGTPKAALDLLAQEFTGKEAGRYKSSLIQNVTGKGAIGEIPVHLFNIGVK